VEHTRRPELVTKRGRPVAALVPIDADELEDLVLEVVPSFVRSMHEADRDLRAGRTRPAADFFKELHETD
jgi:antitoxin (DNA-binding transcriptional repressor) of toxin-antitoxin stability system